jgi:hypothetical protein
MLVSVVLGALLSGCGSGPVTAAARTGAGPASTANPHLAGPGPVRPPASAADVARSIADRWSAAGGPTPTTNLPIEFRTIDYTADVFNPGDPEGFTAFVTTRHTTLVTPASAATIDASNDAAPRFATPADQQLWQAAGRPVLERATATGQTRTVPTDQFSFLLQGTNLTYRQATALPARPDPLAAAIEDHLPVHPGAHPPTNLELRLVAYLIATAPLTNAVRSAAWQVVASLPGLFSCGNPAGSAQTRTADLCVDSADEETMVSVSIATGAVLSVGRRLLRTSASYPHVAAGTVVESVTFLTG